MQTAEMTVQDAEEIMARWRQLSITDKSRVDPAIQELAAEAGELLENLDADLDAMIENCFGDVDVLSDID
jgi:hypothetical protein